MPVCTCADSRLPPVITYSAQTTPMAASVPVISPRGTLNRDTRRAAMTSDIPILREIV